MKTSSYNTHQPESMPSATLRHITLIAIITLSVAGCDESNELSVDPKQACIDVGHELALAGERCGQCTYAECQSSWQKTIGGDCSKAIGVRDADELYNQCIPYLQDIFCPLAEMGAPLDSSCRSQIRTQ